MKRFPILFISILFFSNLLFAHGDEEHGKKTDTVTVVGKDTIAINGIAVDIAEAEKEETVESHAEEKQPAFFSHLTEHMHNKLVHIPIGFVLAAFLITLLGFKWDGLDASIKTLVVIGALSTIAVYLTGMAQKAPFENTVKESIVATHQVLGISTAISIWLWAIILFIKPLKKYAWLVGAAAFILVLITGLYGGMVAH